MNSPIFEVQPIGGVGEIGSNMAIINSGNASILIDCGILFPDEDIFDINYIIPDYSQIPYIDRIIITHGHEDHIGAITHLVDHLPEIEILCTNFTQELIQRKFKFLNRPFPNITTITLDDVITFGEFDINFIHVNHSIPQTMGLLFTSTKKSLSVFYASDFKVDHHTPYEKPFDFKKLKGLSGSMKKRIFLCDSTNIVSKRNKTLSESELIPDLDNILSKAKSRVFVTLFSSNIHRLQTFVNLAKKYKKKIVLQGRAMQSYVQTARQCYLLEASDDQFIESKSVESYARKNLLIIVSGCQADFKSALSRIASDNDPIFKLDKMDTFIFSSKAIPGNEKKISRVLNKITEKGTALFTSDNATIHASGHPCKEDLLEVYKEYNPNVIAPIHGETFFLERHCQYINSIFPQASSLKITNYDKLIINDDLSLNVIPSEGFETRLIQGSKVEIERDQIRQRRKIAHSGCVIFSARRDDLLKFKQTYKLEMVGLPELLTDHLDQLESSLINMLNAIKSKKSSDYEEKIRIHIRQFINKIIGYKPVTYVHLV